MAAHIGHSTRSRRFIKLYLATWALLALGALGYLALLAFPPPAGAPPPQAEVNPLKANPPKAGASETKALAEVRGSLSEIRKDVSQLQEAVGERVMNEKVVQTRLTALEERVSGIDGSQQPPTTMTPSTTLTVPPGTVLDKSSSKAGDPRPSPGSDAPTTASGVIPPVAPIETGSIGSKAEIVFGEPVVTPVNQTEFAVQLAAGPSLEGLRQSWGQISERHAGTLSTLQPRVVPPRSEGGLYRLLAGPVRTKADAERICTQLGVGPKACFATTYAGSPL